MCDITNSISVNLPFEVGSLQGTKLGPMLWFIYANDLQVDGYHCMKYEDDTAFYNPVRGLTLMLLKP